MLYIKVAKGSSL
jgi:hypothetical protein